MSEHNWMPTEMKGVIGLKVEEYERLKADSKRLDKLSELVRLGKPTVHLYSVDRDGGTVVIRAGDLRVEGYGFNQAIDKLEK